MKRYKRILVQLGVLLLIAAIFMFPIMDDIGWWKVVEPAKNNDLGEVATAYPSHIDGYPAPWEGYPAPSYPPPYEGYPPPFEGYPPPPTEVAVPTLPLIETYTPTPLPTLPPPPTPAPGY